MNKLILTIIFLILLFVLFFELLQSFKLSNHGKEICNVHGLEYVDYEGDDRLLMYRFDYAICRTKCGEDYCKIEYYTFTK